MSQVLALNTQVSSTQYDYETLLQRKQQLSEQLTAVQFTLMDSSSAEVVEHINQLQLEQTKQQGIVQHAQQILQQLQSQLEQAKDGAEQILLEAIIKQDWYTFKGKREIVFDKRSGIVFPNFEYVPHIKFEQWTENKKTYSPSNVRKGEWVRLQDINSYYFYDINNQFRGNHVHLFNYPQCFRGKNIVKICEYYKSEYENGRNYYRYSFEAFGKDILSLDYLIEDGHHLSPYHVLPILPILQNIDIHPDYPSTTALEKAKIILDFFIEQEWVPEFETTAEFLADNQSYKFENDEEQQEYIQKLDKLYADLLQRYQLQKQLVEIEQQLAELPEPAQTWLSADFNYRPVLAQYPLTEIAQSVWQYSQSAQKWLNTLLEQLDEWESEHSDVITTAQSINTIFAEKLQLSSQLNEQECAVLNEQHQYLKQKLNFSLIPTKQKLIALLEQNQQLEQKLEQTDDLQSLAELE